MAEYTYTPGAHLADVYGELKAEQAELAKREKAIKAALIKMGQPAVEGTYFRVTVSEIEASETFDAAAAKTWLTDHGFPLPMAPRKPSLRFAVKARKAKAA